MTTPHAGVAEHRIDKSPSFATMPGGFRLYG